MQTWQQELTQCIRTLEQLEAFFPLTNREAIRSAIGRMRLSITPHTQRLIDWNNPRDPLLLMSVPRQRELTISPEELSDPIGDDAKSPVPFLTHRYPDRVLIYATFACAGYCRFCFRRTKTGIATPGPSVNDLDRICEYLQQHPEVDEAILTGGDPLTLVDCRLENILDKLRAVPSLTRLRIHTRVPVNLPSRITADLIALLRRHLDSTHPLYVVTHFNHPREIAPENVEAIARLVDAGIVVRNQSVLLRGVNDDAEILERLFKRLTDIRVVLYYLHQLDLARGTNHFRVSLERGIELMRQLQGRVTGIALPRYVLDIPGGHGKIPLVHRYHYCRKDGTYEVESAGGEKVTYPEPLFISPS